LKSGVRTRLPRVGHDQRWGTRRFSSSNQCCAKIEFGSRFIYLQPADLATPSGSDVTLDLPGPGNNSASGHCALDPQNNCFGRCSFSGGTGKLTWFTAIVEVSHSDDYSLWFWEGAHRFSLRD
jgi:hypothetical protein